jgi:hypothetical protein
MNETPNRSEMVIVFAAFTLWGVVLGVFVGWLLFA